MDLTAAQHTANDAPVAAQLIARTRYGSFCPVDFHADLDTRPPPTRLADIVGDIAIHIGGSLGDLLGATTQLQITPNQ